MRRRRPCTSHAQPLGERQTETSEGLSAVVRISVTRTGAEEATICSENSPEDERAAPAAAVVTEALSEVDARAEGVPSMEDLLSPPIPLPPLIRGLSPEDGVAAGVRGVENMSPAVFLNQFPSAVVQAHKWFENCSSICCFGIWIWMGVSQFIS